MSDPETLAEIVRLKEALERPQDASDSEAEDIPMTASTNRGNKLKRGSRYVAWTALNVPQPPVDVQLVEYGGEKRALIRKRRRLLYKEDLAESSSAGNKHDSDDSEDDEIITEIKLGNVLAPISDPIQVPNHPGLLRTFQSNVFKHLSAEVLDTIVDERAHTASLGNLLATFLGDDPSLLEVGNIEKESAKNKDDFFGVVTPHFDRNQSLPEAEAEEMRQLLQLAYQRMDEYTRCLERVRMGFTRAERLKRKVLNWCKEMDGQDWVEQENGPDEFGIAKQAMALEELAATEAASATATETS